MNLNFIANESKIKNDYKTYQRYYVARLYIIVVKVNDSAHNVWKHSSAYNRHNQ